MTDYTQEVWTKPPHCNRKPPPVAQRQERRSIAHRLSDADVEAIRHESAAGSTDADIATKWSMSQEYVSLLRLGHNRPNAPGPITVSKLSRRTTPWNEDEESDLLRLRKYGLSWTAIGEELGRSANACRNKAQREARK